MTWMLATAELRSRLKVAVTINGGLQISTEGCRSLLALITDMSQKLDAAVIVQESHAPSLQPTG